MSVADNRLPAPTVLLMPFGAAAGIAGGVLRIVSAFVPYEAGQAWLEACYAVIDICLLIGLVAVYLASAEAIGVIRFVLFLVAMAGMASIVGPDAHAFGVDFYRVGAMVFVIALAGLSLQLLLKKTLVPSAVLWIATLACSLVAAAPVAFALTGILLGAGFVLAGLAILRR